MYNELRKSPHGQLNNGETFLLGPTIYKLNLTEWLHHTVCEQGLAQYHACTDEVTQAFIWLPNPKEGGHDSAHDIVATISAL